MVVCYKNNTRVSLDSFESIRTILRIYNYIYWSLRFHFEYNNTDADRLTLAGHILRVLVID